MVERSASPKNDVQAPAASVAAVRATYRGDVRGMRRRRQPVVNRGTDSSADHWRLAFAFVPSDQQQDSVTGRDGPLERVVDREPCRVEAMSVKVEGPVRLDAARAKPPIPTAIEGRGLQGADRSRGSRRRGRGRNAAPHLGRALRRNLHFLRHRRRAPFGKRLARQGANGRGYSLPKLLFVRGEVAHAPLRPVEGG